MGWNDFFTAYRNPSICRRRKTTIRSDSEMFTDDFAKRPDKQIQWTAFVKKGTFTEVPGEFARLMTDIRTFFLPIAQSCETSKPFKYLWPTGGPWSGQKKLTSHLKNVDHVQRQGADR